MQKEEQLEMTDFSGALLLGLDVAPQQRVVDSVVTGYLWNQTKCHLFTKERGGEKSKTIICLHYASCAMSHCHCLLFSLGHTSQVLPYLSLYLSMCPAQSFHTVFSYIFAKLNSKYSSREGIFPVISSTMNAPKAFAWFFTRVRQVFHATKLIQFLKLFVNCTYR